MRFICALRGFAETWLDPFMWRFHLSGWSVTVSGHVYADPTYRVEGDREIERAVCVRCGDVMLGWRAMG
jgi:hypothetical protein